VRRRHRRCCHNAPEHRTGHFCGPQPQASRGLLFVVLLLVTIPTLRVAITPETYSSATIRHGIQEACRRALSAPNARRGADTKHPNQRGH
jgi:hypothetical protein